jgi:hypothetical protein
MQRSYSCQMRDGLKSRQPFSIKDSAPRSIVRLLSCTLSIALGSLQEFRGVSQLTAQITRPLTPPFSSYRPKPQWYASLELFLGYQHLYHRTSSTTEVRSHKLCSPSRTLTARANFALHKLRRSENDLRDLENRAKGRSLSAGVLQFWWTRKNHCAVVSTKPERV